MDAAAANCTRSLFSTIWGALLTIIVYTEEIWDWSIDRSEIRDRHPHFYKLMNGRCRNIVMKWDLGPNYSSIILTNGLATIFDLLLRGISTTLDIMLQFHMLSIMDQVNLGLESRLAKAVGHDVLDRRTRMMAVCSQFYIYLQPSADVDQQHSATDTHVPDQEANYAGTASASVDRAPGRVGSVAAATALMEQQLGELIPKEYTLEIRDAVTKEDIVKSSHLIVGEAPVKQNLASAMIFKVLKTDEEVSLITAKALLESGIVLHRSSTVLADAKDVVSASLFTRLALATQALGYLYAFASRWVQKAPVSSPEMIATYYALFMLRRATTHLLGITYSIRKPLLIHLDTDMLNSISAAAATQPPVVHSPLNDPLATGSTCFAESIRRNWRYCLVFIIDFGINCMAGAYFPKFTFYAATSCGRHGLFLILPFTFFAVVWLGNQFQIFFISCCPPLLDSVFRMARVLFMIIALSTALASVVLLSDDCGYDKELSTNLFSLPFLQ